MHVPAQLGAQIDDWIHNQLAGAVVGNIAAAADAMNWDIFGCDDIFKLSAATNGENVGMLDKNNNVRKQLALLGSDDVFLKFQSRKIIQRTKICDRQHATLTLFSLPSSFKFPSRDGAVCRKKSLRLQSAEIYPEK